MNLSRLLDGVHIIPGRILDDLTVTSVAADSRKVTAGGVFVCVRGLMVDGHDYIRDAAVKGAAAVICDHIPNGADGLNLAFVLVEDTRAALAKIAANFYGNPQRKLTLVGVTGTKGKTSTTYYIKSILETAGRLTGIIGTNGVLVGDTHIDIPFETSSTPDILDLYAILRAIVDAGGQYAVMEASSQGLTQRRTEGLEFAAGVFTNLQHDHLDYHKTVENYGNAKAKLFTQSKAGVINLDDPWAERMAANLRDTPVFYGIGARDGNGYFAENVILSPEGVSFNVRIDGAVQPFELRVPGRFTVYNALAAIATARVLGLSAAEMQAGLKTIDGVAGRFQRIPNNKGITVIVDYAHTPESLENIIKAVREFTAGRLITLFGCGGDRDRQKRPVMGEIAGRLSDYCVLTSDNPRNENPEVIINEIIPGLLKTGAAYITEPDRRVAIEAAINMAKPGDAVIIAGKGHEPYQEFENRRREHFDDREEAKRVLTL